MKVKGMAFNARIEFVKKKFGPLQVIEVLNAVPRVKELHDAGNGFYPSRLYGYGDYTAFNQAVCNLLYNGREAAYHEMGEHSAKSALTTVHKIFVMDRDIRSFLRSLNVIFNAYYVGLGSGHAEISETENFARATITGTPDPHRSLCQIVFYYMKHGMELCGAKNVFLSEKTCACRGDESCSVELRWNS